MKKFFPAFFLALALLSCARQGVRNGLDRLDDVLQMKGTYEKSLVDKVDVLKEVAAGSAPVQAYDICLRIADEYSRFSLDSTVAYLEKARNAASSVGDKDAVVRAELATAKAYAKAGYHSDAQYILGRYSNSVPAGCKADYLRACQVLYGELAVYSGQGSSYWPLRDSCRNELLALVYPEPSECYEWLNLKREEAESMGQDSLARAYTSRMLECAGVDTPESAEASFFYQLYLDDDSERMEWLARSAIADVVCATKDYASLNTLSEMLFSAGDIDRAFRYSAEYCMPDALAFNGKLRPWQIAQFFPQIEAAYATKSSKQVTKLRIIVFIAMSLLVLLAVLFIVLFRSNRELFRTRKELESARERVERRNSSLEEANTVKTEYISLFLRMLSENITTKRHHNNHILKYLRRGNDKYLIEEIEALPSEDEDIQEFYRMFDKTFINIYPGFVDKFNALLADGKEICPKGDEILAPEIRVFALIKLGITDSSSIANLLHYSANTVYNYRAKVKNRALDRDRFEDAVKSIE